MAMTDAARRAFYVRSRDLWIKREKMYKTKAADAHKRHVQRSKQLSAMTTAVAMPVETNLAADTNGWTGPNAHDGIDLICPPAAPLHAMTRSKVVRVSPAGWWGNNPQPSPGHPVGDGDGIIILECLVNVGPFKPGLHVCYGHAEHATVKVGQVVDAGEVIGKAGFARAWHVHFMINDDAPVNGLYRGVGDRDPRPYLDFARSHA